ncbi:MAG: aminopeptidase [Phycisphaerales bacterium]|nr:aminopeptidase [Phycisphaerales bacterium]
MADSRYATLADVLITHSTRLAPGEHVLIEAFDTPDEMVVALVRAARRAGGHPHVALRHARVMRALNADADEDNLAVWADCDRHRMALMDAYLGLRGSHNVSEMAGIDTAQMQRVTRIYGKPVHFDQRVNHTKWCVLRWPTPSMAQLAGLSTEAFEDFYFDVCTLDYARMDEAVKPLVERMQRADRVRLVGPGDTDLSFSIRDIPVIACTGENNIPDGECFTAPVRDSVNGVIHFNTPTIYNGRSFNNVRLEFRDGRVVDAGADADVDGLNAILDTDDGARHVGEFAIGFNPYIRSAMKDILFDEKIAGSLHFTPGRAYEDADNGNRSEIHWDLVLIQRPEYGGGEIRFDDEVIRRDGLFVVDDLLALNPDALIG